MPYTLPYFHNSQDTSRSHIFTMLSQFNKIYRPLAVMLSSLYQMVAAATPMTASESESRRTSQRPPKPTTAPARGPKDLLKRQDQVQTCATLDGYDPQWAAPFVCTGSSPQCVASGSLFGCYDSGDYTLYNTCYNAIDSASCTGSCTNTAIVW